MSRVPLAVRLRYLLRRAGWPALAGAALFVGALTMQFAMVEPAATKLADVRGRIAKARSPRNTASAAVTDAAGVLAALPTREALEAAVGAIHHAAAAQGIVTAGAEYRARKEGEFMRYEISLPVRAAWDPLRRWLAAIVEQQPALAVDELGLRRDKAEQEQLDGRVRLTLFLRTRGQPAAAATPVAVSPAPTFEAALPTRVHPAAMVDPALLFAARSWQPPPPPPSPRPRPTAPPLPFKYAGKLIEDKTVRVFLTQGDTTTLVAQGDKLGNYDIERVTTASVVLLFRPLQEKQTLNFGGYD